MADGVAITAGSGTTIATDDCGAPGHAQVMKLAISTDGSATLVGADTTNGLDVDVTRVIPGTAATELGKAEDAAHASGDVGVMALAVRNDADAALSGTDGDYTPIACSSSGKLIICSTRDTLRISVQSGGLSTGAAYAVGDQMGTQFTLPNAARASGSTGRIRAVQIIDAADVIGAIDVQFFRASVTLASDNAVYSISDSDALNAVAYVQCASVLDMSGSRMTWANGLDIPYDCSGTSLFAALIARFANSQFAAATDIQLIVFVERD